MDALVLKTFAKFRMDRSGWKLMIVGCTYENGFNGRHLPLRYKKPATESSCTAALQKSSKVGMRFPHFVLLLDGRITMLLDELETVSPARRLS